MVVMVLLLLLDYTTTTPMGRRCQRNLGVDFCPYYTVSYTSSPHYFAFCSLLV
jgi:hypothetical protein